MLRASCAVACCCAMRLASAVLLGVAPGREAADRSTSKQLRAGPTIPASPAGTSLSQHMVKADNPIPLPKLP